MSSRFQPITALLQSQLTRQMGKVADFLDHEESYPAFLSIRTLVIMLNKKHVEEVLKEIKQIEWQLKQLSNRKSIDIYLSRGKTRNSFHHYLYPKTIQLFHEVNQIMYEKGYLEMEPVKPTHEKGKLGLRQNG